MLFVTRFTGYQMLARSDITKIVQDPRGPEWGTQTIVMQEPVWIQFKPKGILTYAQREAAQDFFDPPSLDGQRPGPYRYSGVAGDPDFEGMTYEASDHWLFYSTFNTETDCPPVTDLSPEEVRELVERVLLGSAQLGVDFIRVDEASVPLPWPRYEETHHKQIAPMVRNLGLDPRLVIAYEQSRADPRPGVIADLEALTVQVDAEAAAVEQLTVRG